MKNTFLLYQKKIAAVCMASVLVLAFNNCAKGGFKIQSSTLGSGSFSSVEAKSRFETAKDVLARNCYSCHNGGSPNLNLATEDQYISAGLVAAGDIAGSKLITRLTLYPGATTAARNMPMIGTMSQADYNSLAAWVSMINIGTPPPVVGTPQIVITSTIPAVTKDLNFAASFYVTANGSTIASVNCQLSSATVAGTLQNCSSLSVSYTNLVDGDYSFKIIVDTQGGQQVSETRSFRKDSTVPVVNVTATPPATSSSGTTGFTFNASDNLSGVSSLECLLDSAAAFSTCTSPNVFSPALAAGIHTFKIRATDMAGNVSNVYSYTWTYDPTSLSVSITAMTPATAFTKLQTASFSFSGTRAVGYDCRMDSAAFAACTSPVNYTGLTVQAHTFQVRAKDSAGALSSVASYSWTIDGGAPTTPVLMSNVTSPTTSTSISISFSASDALSGVASYQCSLDNAAYATCVSPRGAMGLAVGAHSMRVTATDNVGNVSPAATYSWTVQAPPPVVLTGAQLFANNCSGCHTPASRAGYSAATITTAINGKITAMAGLKSLTAAQIDLIAAYLGGSTGGGTTLACATNENLIKPQIKRLTATQFKNSLSNAFGNIFSAAQFPAFNDANPRVDFQSNPDNVRIDEGNIVNIYTATKALVATALTQNATVSSCISSTTDTCVTSLISTMGLKLWRRPLTTTETNDFNTNMATAVTAGATRSQKIELLLTSLILSPNHMYRTEIGGSATASTAIVDLTAYEVASLLSFSLLDSPPDDTLLGLAQSGQLLTAANLKAQVARLSLDTRFASKLSDFQIDLLKMGSVLTASKDASYNFTAAQRQALFDSASLTLNDIFKDPKVNFYAPYSNTQFFMNNSSASFFNLTSASATFTKTATNALQRYGMLSHPAFLTVVANPLGTGIVQRGIFAIGQLLCGSIGGPPANVTGVTNLPAGWNPNLVTEREVLEVTHASQPSCIGCHSIIDPLGAGFENFNSMGVFRTTEKNNIAIDASGNISSMTTTPLVFSDSVGYLKALASNDTFKECISKKFFQYSLGQSYQSSNAVKCEFNNYKTKNSAKDGSAYSFVETLTEVDSFKRRNPAAK